MNKKIISLLLFGVMCTPAFGAFINWWEQPYICQIDNTPCYNNLTNGIDNEWDVTASCRGRKYVCGDAIVGTTTSTTAMNKSAIKTDINSDFDVDVYVSGENCYGARKTTDNGRMASVNGRYVRVWCSGILNHPTETLSNGEVTSGAEPTCKQLANDGYAAVANGTCYGKYYKPESYAIECNGETPSLIVLNGAEYNPNARTPLTPSIATGRFSTMQTLSATQRAKYFKNK